MKFLLLTILLFLLLVIVLPILRGLAKGFTMKSEPDPLMIQYVDLLHRYGDPEDPAIKSFIETHRQDALFMQRAATMNEVWEIKKQLS